MKFNSNKEKQNIGLKIAIAYYTSNEYTVFIPLNETQDYNLLVDKKEKIIKVQVKLHHVRKNMVYIKLH